MTGAPEISRLSFAPDSVWRDKSTFSGLPTSVWQTNLAFQVTCHVYLIVYGRPKTQLSSHNRDRVDKLHYLLSFG